MELTLEQKRELKLILDNHISFAAFTGMIANQLVSNTERMTEELVRDALEIKVITRKMGATSIPSVPKTNIQIHKQQ